MPSWRISLDRSVPTEGQRGVRGTDRIRPRGGAGTKLPFPAGPGNRPEGRRGDPGGACRADDLHDRYRQLPQDRRAVREPPAHSPALRRGRQAAVFRRGAKPGLTFGAEGLVSPLVGPVPWRRWRCRFNGHAPRWTALLMKVRSGAAKDACGLSPRCALCKSRSGRRRCRTTRSRIRHARP